jgi:D-serine deaminase-like pyridoxal phosphate-dependent protein
VNELRSGTYALLDRNEAESESRCALWVEATVISDAVPGQVVVDGGSKTFTSDPFPEGGHGTVIGSPGARFVRVNEEHGYVDVSALDERPRVGDHLQIVPNHACGCMNLHDGVLAVRGGIVDHVILVAGRGLVR